MSSSIVHGPARDRQLLSTDARAAVTMGAMLQKVGVVGVGGVGQACAFALLLRGSAREIVLVDRAAERATGVATDMRYGAPLSPAVDIRSGDWGDLAGARGGVIFSGGNEETGGA